MNEKPDLAQLLACAGIFITGMIVGGLLLWDNTTQPVATSEACAYLFAQADTVSVVKEHPNCLRYAWEPDA